MTRRAARIRFRNVRWYVALVLLAAITPGCLSSRKADITGRVYRIGWMISPPFQVRGGDGKPTGLAVDLVREAARRKGIALEWVFWQNSSESALRTRKVDIWPFITITPERLKNFHITAPYMEIDHCLLVRADTAFRKLDDLARSSIGIANPSIDLQKLHGSLPDTRTVVRATPKQLIEEVCAQRADAAFMDAYTGISALLEERACGGHPLRWIEVPQIKTRLGIGATFANRAVADALREEIGAISREGKLGPIVGQWGYMSARSLESMGELIDARERESRLVGTTVLFAILFTVACWQTVRVTRERNRAGRAELALRGTEQKLRLMANNLKEMVLAFDMDRKLIYANPAVETLTGFSIADLESRGLIDWFHPDDRSRMLARRDALFRGAGFQDEEYRLATAGGAVKWAAASWGPILDEAGAQVGVQGSERDITQRKLAEDALRDSERRFRGLLENIQIAAAMFDRQGNFTFCNDFLLAITGWTREEILGRPVVEFAAPEDKSRMMEIVETWSLTGEPLTWSDEPVLLTKSGDRRWLQANHVAVCDVDGEVVGFASLAVDVTEHRALQKQYLQAQRLESVGRLAGGIAHDFNNMLTVIGGYSDLLIRRLGKSDPLLDAATEIRNAGKQAAGLIGQLLAFSRKRAIELKPVDINHLIAANLGMFRHLMGDDVELVTRLEPALGLTMADSGQLTQVLINMAVNARDAMPGGGTLTVCTANVEAAQDAAVPRSEWRPGPFVLLAVSDTGMGIDEDTLPSIFDPFFTTKGEGEGTGLGLSMVHGIVEQCSGSISVQSRVGSGTTFQIYLPRVDPSVTIPAAAAAIDSTATAHAWAGSETVLVVEDRAEVRQLTITLLKGWGYRVLEAARGDEAMLIAERYPNTIHLLLTDVVMPRMSGHELARRLAPLRPEMKVVYMSGYDNAVRPGEPLPAAEYLSKPFSGDELAASIRRALESMPDANTRAGHRSTRRILMADDNESIRALFGELLHEAGYAVTTVSNAADAMACARTGAFDLVIADLNMPGGNGHEMVRAFRAEFPGIRIVVISGLIDEWSRQRIMAQGADAAIEKRLVSDSLVDTVDKLLGK